MTTTKKNVPVAGQGNEDNNETAKHSITTAYLARRDRNTGVTLGTWSGTDLPMEDHITLVVPMSAAQRIYADGSGVIRLNPGCVQAQSAEVRKARAEKKRKAREEYVRKVRARVGEEFEEELEAIDAQAEEVYARIDAQVQAELDRLDAEEGAGQ